MSSQVKRSGVGDAWPGFEQLTAMDEPGHPIDRKEGPGTDRYELGNIGLNIAWARERRLGQKCNVP